MVLSSLLGGRKQSLKLSLNDWLMIQIVLCVTLLCTGHHQLICLLMTIEQFDL